MTFLAGYDIILPSDLSSLRMYLFSDVRSLYNNIAPISQPYMYLHMDGEEGRGRFVYIGDRDAGKEGLDNQGRKEQEPEPPRAVRLPFLKMKRLS